MNYLFFCNSLYGIFSLFIAIYHWLSTLLSYVSPLLSTVSGSGFSSESKFKITSIVFQCSVVIRIILIGIPMLHIQSYFCSTLEWSFDWRKYHQKWKIIEIENSFDFWQVSADFLSLTDVNFACFQNNNKPISIIEHQCQIGFSAEKNMAIR